MGVQPTFEWRNAGETGNPMDRKDINKYEEKCIQEQAPACVASCPVHVDVRKMNAQIRQGDFDGALRTFSASVPFPRIISRICSQPCRSSCRRGRVCTPHAASPASGLRPASRMRSTGTGVSPDAGEAGISISLLERACIEYGSFPERKSSSATKKRKTAAIIGAGLCGLTAAVSLADKGYDVVIYEKSSNLGGGIRDLPEDILPAELIAEDLKIVENSRVALKLNSPVANQDDFERLCQQYDAVYVACGGNPGNPFGLPLDESGRIAVVPDTFQTGNPRVFAEGGLLMAAPEVSPIAAISDRKRAAISIDRYLQKVSLTAAREREGVYATRLYTNLEGIAAVPGILPLDAQQGYAREEALDEAGRCIQCQCLECVRVCPYLQHYEKYPKKYIREISNNIAIIFGKKRAKDLINSCTMCGLCAEVCPNLLNMGEVSLLARSLMVDRGDMPPAIHDFPIRDMLFSNSEKFALHKNQPGFGSSRYAFFPGCQLSALEPDYIEKVYSDLTSRLPGGVGLLLRCCGVPAKWAGRQGLLAGTMNELREEWLKLGQPELICACSTCYQEIKNNLSQIPATSLWQIYDQYGLPESARELTPPQSVAIHDPCTTRHEPVFQECSRRILARLGYRVEELPLSGDKTECCGYGGLVASANPGLAAKITDTRAAESDLDYVVYCANCKDFLSSRGKTAWHILDLIYDHPEKSGAAGRRLGYSQRQENRAKLKDEMLKVIWGETMSQEKSSYETVKLNISEEVLNQAEARLILREDIQKTISYAEETGLKVYSSDTGHIIAHYRPQIITYWVEYSKDNNSDSFTVHRAYSHRLEIVEDVAQ
jgi:NADPH-dependent glutamate synthase beta subunit-like oxidoreductase